MAATSEYLVTARKWRPQRFAEVVGQDHVTTTLRNALASGRIHHAYLFCGPRGVGKTTTARIIARAINCASPLDGIEPCNECESCRDILSGRSMDVVEIDGASNNSVEDIRRIRENAKYPPTYGKYKVYIIDEVHMLSTSAFNALLKTLEEPPAHLLFIFATTEPHKVPATIQSRCQRFDFHRMDTRTIAAHLRTIADAEKVAIDDDALFTIARFADGSMRDAQSLFDQVRAFSTDTITGDAVRRSLHVLGDDVFFAITDAIARRDLGAAFELAHTIVSHGFDVQQAMLGLLEHLRNALTVRATGSTELIEAADETRERYRQLAEQFSQEDLVQMMTIVATAEQQLRYAAQPRVRLELLLSQLVHLPSAVEIGTLVAELEKLRSSGVAVVEPTASQPRTTAPTATAPPTVSSTEQTTAALPTASQPTTPPESRTSSTFDWQVFVAELPPQLQIVRTVLAEQPPPQFDGDRVVITCGDATALDALQLKRQQLSRFLAKKLGRTVELVIERREQPIPPAQPTSAPQQQTTQATTTDELAPIERALIEKFGAKRIPLL
ncbi:MAG: DNA polymerase III subunit gamma/tau [Chlorobi bacterium]|nr:DNA polymerase III subunit gamma/tau [Chlorobiota bacterium]